MSGSEERPATARERERERREARRREREQRRRRGVPLLLALIAVVVALGGGIAVGYLVRGEPAPSGLETVEREVPIITVTVPEGGG
jgi:cell division septal protein FtsQ